jgi:hypothetical protein
MLNSPALKANATARPAKIIGVAFSSVRPKAVMLPNEPRSNAT